MLFECYFGRKFVFFCHFENVETLSISGVVSVLVVLGGLLWCVGMKSRVVIICSLTAFEGG